MSGRIDVKGRGRRVGGLSGAGPLLFLCALLAPTAAFVMA